MPYKVPFVRPSYQRFYAKHGKEVDAAIKKCHENGDYTLRQEVWTLEKNIAKFVGTKYCATVNSGTDALHLSLLALGIGRGDEVITVSNTFVATLQAIVHTGATPILVDVKDDEQMDIDEVVAAWSLRTKAIMPVHYTGDMVNMKALMELANRWEIPVVEDYCQALGAKQGHKMAGSFGKINAVSFNTAKLLGGMADGGAVTTNDRELYEKVCLLRNHWNIHQLSVDRNDYPQPESIHWAWKSRLSNVNAAFLNVKFKTIKTILANREKIAKKYNAAFVGLPIVTPPETKGRIYQEYHLQVKDREHLASYLKSKGIETLVRDTTPNHQLDFLGLSHFSLPTTERLASEVIRLPLHEWLKDSEVEYVVKAVRSFYGYK